MQLSHDDHMILEGHSVSEASEVCSEWCSGGGLGCDHARSKVSSWVRSGLIQGTDQVGEVLRGVSEVILMGLM